MDDISTKAKRAKRVFLACSAASITTSALVLAGWHWRLPNLKTFPGQTTVVAPNTALCFLLLALSLLLLENENGARIRLFFGKLIAAAVCLFSGLTLVEYISGVSFGIDEVFFGYRMQDWPVPTPPGRFAVQSAMSFFAFSIAVLLLDRRAGKVRLSDVFTCLAMLPPMMALLGYVYGSSLLHGVMSLGTILLFAFSISALALVRSDGGVTGLLLSSRGGGIAARHLIVANTAVLILIGWVYLRLRNAGLLDHGNGVAIMTSSSLVAVTILILWTANKLETLEVEREATSVALVQTLSQKQNSEDRLNEGLETASAAIWDFDFLTNQLYWSRCHYTLLGYEPDEIKPTFAGWHNRIHPDDLERVEQLWDECLKSNKVFACQYRVIWQDGSVHWMETKGKFMYDEQGRPIRSIGGFVDITERKRSEQALMGAEKLAATGRMAATLAHEINNPLAAVTNLIYLLKSEGLVAQGAAREYLQMADDEIRRVAHLVRKTLSFYRADVSPAPAKIAEIVDEVLWLYSKRIRDGSVNIVKQYAPCDEILCKSGEVRQVLTNVFVNALDAVGTGGTIIVRVSPSHDWSNGGHAGIRVTIADTGGGIPSEVRAQLFTPFFSLKGDRGTGLGLWISKGIMERNGGRIRFRSRTAQPSGTVFCIFIPPAERESQQRSIANSA